MPELALRRSFLSNQFEIVGFLQFPASVYRLYTEHSAYSVHTVQYLLLGVPVVLAAPQTTISSNFQIVTLKLFHINVDTIIFTQCTMYIIVKCANCKLIIYSILFTIVLNLSMSTK
jgi:hypothetical protein